MKTLNKELAKERQLIAIKDYDKLPERILQFGEGNFLRGFIDCMVDEMNAKGLFNGRVVVVQPRGKDKAALLNSQDGLYTLFLRGMQNGMLHNERRVISSISRCLNFIDEYDAFLKTAHNPDLRFIVSNTTEAGIAYAPEELVDGRAPATFPAKLTVLMYERFKHFGGDAAKGFVLIPCELLEHNGKKLREAVLQYAALWKLGAAFEAWVKEVNAFLNTLVDRVVSGYPHDEAAALEAELGYKDSFMDVGEYFYMLAIEGDRKYAKELPFAEAGIDVIWTDDLAPYRQRKVKILNGAHTSATLAGYLAGLETVREYTEDAVIGRYLEALIYGELVPTVNLPDTERKAYAAAVIERFKNPFVKHYCLSIALNSVSKFKVRVLPSLEELTVKNAPKLCFALAALIVFYKVVEVTNDGKAFGITADGRKYPILDDQHVVESFTAYWKEANTATTVAKVLANTQFWGKDLTSIAGLSDIVSVYVQNILNKGIVEAVKEIL